MKSSNNTLEGMARKYCFGIGYIKARHEARPAFG
jgi:hypothetical protein